MRKIIALLTFLLLLAGLMQVSAASPELSMSDCTGAPGDTVLITVELSQTVDVSSMGIRYSFDETLLEPNTDWCEWIPESGLQDFNDENRGVWATQDPKKISGEICVLAFRIKKDAAFVETKVTCELTVKYGTSADQVYTAEAIITTNCRHDFGEGWTGDDITGHQRRCSICGASQMADHKFDDGVILPDPEDTGKQIKRFTCTVCEMTHDVAVPVSPNPTDKDDESTDPTMPPQNPGRPGNSETSTPGGNAQDTTAGTFGQDSTEWSPEQYPTKPPEEDLPYEPTHEPVSTKPTEWPSQNTTGTTPPDTGAAGNTSPDTGATGNTPDYPDATDETHSHSNTAETADTKEETLPPDDTQDDTADTTEEDTVQSTWPQVVDDHAGHDHGPLLESDPNFGTGAIAVAIIAAVLAGVMLLIRKKK